jgi:hypothetical protein
MKPAFAVTILFTMAVAGAAAQARGANACTAEQAEAIRICLRVNASFRPAPPRPVCRREISPTACVMTTRNASAR